MYNVIVGSVSNGSGSNGSVGSVVTVGSVVVNRRKLLEALECCAKLSSAWPMHSQFARVKSEGSKIIVESTNKKISVRVVVDTDNIANNVEFTLHCRETIKYLKSLKSDTVTVSYSSNEYKTDVTIDDNGNTENFFNNINANKIPVIPKRQSHVITLSRQEFIDLFEHVCYAAHKEDMRKPALEGCLITFANGKITTVATNGYRLALNSIYKDTNTNLTLLPYARAISIALTLLKKSKSSYVSFWLCDDNHIAISFDNVEIISENIEYPFPNYELVIPQKEQLQYVILTEKDSLLQALKAARESFDDKHNAFVTLETKDNVLMLKTEKITTQIPATSNASEPVTFRIEYLLDAIESLKSDYVAIRLQHDTRQAAVIEHDNFKYVVMPASC